MLKKYTALIIFLTLLVGGTAAQFEEKSDTITEVDVKVQRPLDNQVKILIRDLLGLENPPEFNIPDFIPFIDSNKSDVKFAD